MSRVLSQVTVKDNKDMELVVNAVLRYSEVLKYCIRSSPKTELLCLFEIQQSCYKYAGTLLCVAPAVRRRMVR